MVASDEVSVDRIGGAAETSDRLACAAYFEFEIDSNHLVRTNLNAAQFLLVKPEASAATEYVLAVSNSAL